MARVTIEDCIRVVNNPFDLVILAAKRARDVSAGASITVSRDNDKNPVVALREIAQLTISAENLHDSVVRGMQRSHFVDDQEDQEDMDDEALDDAGASLLDDEEDDTPSEDDLLIEEDAD
jgi:DNA-directed RNA polymerase subunit omega